MNRSLVALTTAACMLAAVAQAGAAAVGNPGFEVPFSTTNWMPLSFGHWDNDPAGSVMAKDGITPREGSWMLQFIASGASLHLGVCNVWQTVDLSSHQAEIADGEAVARASVWFNRVAGDEETDTAFKLELRAYAGTPRQFASYSFVDNPLDGVATDLNSDGDVATWELCAAELLLPANTDFIGIHLSSTENIFNDQLWPEFDGHYADDVCLDIISAATEPPAQMIGGFEIETYADVTDPTVLSFSPTGDLFAGRDNSGSGGGPSDPVRIHKIAPGGYPVTQYGNHPIHNPDGVLFDAAGTISGSPGSVLVASADDAGNANIFAILPNEVIATVFGPESGIVDPEKMIFDNEGRLLVADSRFSAYQGTILAGTGESLSSIVEISTGIDGIAVDLDNRIYAGCYDGKIRVFAADGSLLDDGFVTGLGELSQIALAFGKGFGFGNALYVSAGDVLLRVDSAAKVQVIGTGFGCITDLEFGPDAALYCSVHQDDRVYRITRVIPGDANLDGRVDDVDASFLAIYWHYDGPLELGWEHGDFNADGMVTDADAAILASHWQEGVGEHAAPVPEPTALIGLVSLLGAGWLVGRRRREGQNCDRWSVDNPFLGERAMKSLSSVFLLVGLGIVALECSAHADWSRHKCFVINAGLVADDLTDFPVLVSLGPDDDLASHAQPSGNDIAFTLHGSMETLSHQIEAYSSTTGELQAWVRIPCLSSTTNTNLTMHFGDPALPDQQKPGDVWDGYYKQVLHLQEPSGNCRDSTSNANHGIPFGSVTQGIAGQIANAALFDGQDDYVDIIDVIDDVVCEPGGTISLWIKHEASTTANFFMLSNLVDEGNGVGSNDDRRRSYTSLRSSDAPTGSPQGIQYENNHQWSKMRTDANSYPSDEWFHLAITSDAKIFVNGNEVVGRAASHTINVDNIWLSDNPDADKFSAAALMKAEWMPGSPFFSSGMIDEFRLTAGVARNADWIQTAYNNQSIPSAFLSVLIPGDANFDGKVSDIDAAIVAAYWQYDGPLELGWKHGDFNADGKVTDADAAILATHWQEGVTEATTVPEPTTLIGLVSLLGAGWLVGRRQRDR